MSLRNGMLVMVVAVLACASAQAQDDVTEAQLPDPNRTLSAAEAVALVEQVTVLLDTDRPWDHDRQSALEQLAYEIHHRAALPAMRRVLYDEELSPVPRVDVLHHVAGLGVPEALDDLIKMLRHPVGLLRGNAWFILTRLYPPGKQFGLQPREPIEANEGAITRWEEWWKENRATFKIPIWHPTDTD